MKEIKNQVQKKIKKEEGTKRKEFIQRKEKVKNLEKIEKSKKTKKPEKIEELKTIKEQKVKEKNKRQKKVKGKKRSIDKKEPVHDYFFRKVYEKESNALDLFNLLLTKEEYSFFNWKTLRAELTTYFDENWKENRADLVFSVQIKNKNPVKKKEKKSEDKKKLGNQNLADEGQLSNERKEFLVNQSVIHQEEARFLFLFEHKSYRDTDVLFQLLSYQNSIYQKGRLKSRIYPIIPFVFYHGEKDWKVPESFRDFILQKSSFKQYRGLNSNLLNFRYRLLNLKRYNVEKLPKELTTKTILILMQRLGMSHKEIDIDFLEHAFSLSDHLTFKAKKEKIDLAIQYIEQVVPNVSVKVLQELDEKNSKIGERIMGAYKSGFQIMKERGLKEGREEGRKKGREEGSYETLKKVVQNMLKKKQSISVISEITGLSRKEVLKISEL